MFTVESKNLLARLMATENIRIEHRKMKTAKFDLKNRVLYCPIWADMTGSLYDLLLGHEVGHALRTPEDGWHDSLTYVGKNTKATPQEKQSFKNFLNVVEDARIEKLIKRQYPGLRSPMYTAYGDLVRRGFFGDITKGLYLIDKLNVAAKVGVRAGIHFTKTEQEFYDKMMLVETWDDVVALTHEIWEYSKKEQQLPPPPPPEANEYNMEDEDSEEDLDSFEEGDDYDTYTDEDGDETGDSEDSEEGESEDSDESEEDEDDEEADSTSKKDDEEDGDEDEDSKGSGDKSDEESDTKDEESQTTENPTGAGKDNEADQIPKSKTDEEFRKHEDELLDRDPTEIRYVNIPTPNLKHIVVPAKKVSEGVDKFDWRSEGPKLFDKFRKKNNTYISLLVKEFEMKKAANTYVKAKLAKTGDIDLSRLARYRIDENIFKKITKQPKGKNHGLVLLLDKSSSMRSSYMGAVEQIMILATFCRRVNIPFVAYTFTNYYETLNFDFPKVYGTQEFRQFSNNPSDLSFGSSLSLREIINSNMTASEFTETMMQQFFVAHLLSGKGRQASSWMHEGMSSTPLHESLVAMRDVMVMFKNQYKLDIADLVIVHDGDADGTSAQYNPEGPSIQVPTISFADPNLKIVLRDVKRYKTIAVNHRDARGLTVGLLQWFAETTGTNVYGFYITTPNQRGSAFSKLYQPKSGELLRGVSDAMMYDLCKKLEDQGFVESYSNGYDRFYFLPGENSLKGSENWGDGAIEDRYDIQGNLLEWTPSRLEAAYKAAAKNRKSSRVLASTFIDRIAV